jgi:transcriptional regulator with XRE-family HTH domain
MNPRTSVPGAQEQRNASFGVRVRPDELRRRMQLLGLTGAALAKKAKVAEATVSQARNGRPIHPMKLRAIAAALSQHEPIPGLDGLIDDGSSARPGGVQ